MGFLADRLPEALKKEPIWQELIECFDELFQHYFDRIARQERRRSIFTADDEDLDLMIEEAGDVFNVEWNDATSKPLSILWRRGDLKFKTTSIPMEAMLQRSFVGLDAKWNPYYSPISGTYDIGSLRTKTQIDEFGEDLADFFITSRGFYKIDVRSMLEADISQAEITSIISGQLDRIIPLHIVYDGIRFILSVTFNDLAINASGAYLPNVVNPSGPNQAQLPIDTNVIMFPKIDKGTVDTMDVYAQDDFMLVDAVSLDFWPVDKPLNANDGLTIVYEPIHRLELSGQLGDGQVAPGIVKQLGDGQEISTNSTNLGNGQE